VLDALIEVSRRVGAPEAGLAMLAEGNTSVRDGETFWIKASGEPLKDCGRESFVRCRPEPLLDASGLTDAGAAEALRASLVEGAKKPSVEAFFHAWLLFRAGVSFVLHAHPEPVLALACSANGQASAAARHFPDEVVFCGPASAWVPYVDPGWSLAPAIRDAHDRFSATHGQPPKCYLMENHGLTTVGRTAEEAWSAMAMAVKAARVVLAAPGGAMPLPPEEVARIAGRADEHDRQRRVWGIADPLP
jgi:rhamnose utilization protein RhaD (predicted bifunctional aldolase and dehydrogenase)